MGFLFQQTKKMLRGNNAYVYCSDSPSKEALGEIGSSQAQEVFYKLPLCILEEHWCVLAKWLSGFFLKHPDTFFSFIESSFFPYIIHHDFSFPSLYSPQLLPTSPLIQVYFLSVYHSKTNSLLWDNNTIKHNIKQKLIHWNWAKQTKGKSF